MKRSFNAAYDDLDDRFFKPVVISLRQQVAPTVRAIDHADTAVGATAAVIASLERCAPAEGAAAASTEGGEAARALDDTAAMATEPPARVDRDMHVFEVPREIDQSQSLHHNPPIGGEGGGEGGREEGGTHADVR